MTVSLPRFLPAFLIVFALLLGLAAPESEAAFGPTIKKCGKLKKAKAKRQCKKDNAAMRKAFGAVADSRFAGTLFNGTGIDATFCRSGKWQIEAAVPGIELQVFKGKKWKLKEVSVGRNWIYLNAIGPSKNIHTDVGLHKRGKKWYFSDTNPTLSAPLATRTNAAERCREI